jgi:predicted ATPase/DNA-binding CsgD family transcriptional regulator
MTFPTSTHVGRLYLESRHLPAALGGGGDIHDAMATPFGIRLLIGDVMGTGVPAHETGLAVLNAWRELACTEPSLTGIAVRLHAMIARSEHPERFVTALLMNFPGNGLEEADRTRGSWAEFVCCGHPPPLLLRGGSAAFIEPGAAPPLGLLDLADGWCQASMVPIGEDDQLLLYTDGVSEARDGEGRFFPLAERTAQALAGSADRAGLLDVLVASLDDHRGDHLTDDILLLLVSMTLPARREDSMTPGLVTRPRPGELPVEVTRFVGRQNELAELAGLLRTARLVTVTGPGGVGKTRVALRAATAAAEDFPDGTCLVELSGLHDPELLASTVASCLGRPEAESRSQLDAIIDYLRGQRMLLILDTCEHLIDACAMLADVLLRATQVTVLATSRQTLDVPGEHTCAIPPLPISAGPISAGPISTGPVSAGPVWGQGDAVGLFAQCAAAVVPGFAVTDANRADVIRLCQRLDGLPLAIELATVRLRAIPLGQLAERLQDRFRLLTGGRRAALPHHQTMRAATEWSYDLCSPAEQLLWARLSVFAGSFDVEAVEQVCAGEPLDRKDVLSTLIGLVDKSVVLRVDDGGTRYLLLDTIREFGAEKLAAPGAGCPLAEIVRLAVAGADELPPYPDHPADVGPPVASGLTGREREIADLVAEGLTNRQIAGQLVISKRTVDAHIEHIYGKLGVSSRVQLASWLRSARSAE